MLPKQIIQRLAFIKYLYKTAVEQSSQAEPLCSASILTFHDSIELFLQLSSEYKNSGASRPDFMDYFNILNDKIGQELSQKESIRRLNKSRVALKHHGTMPSKLDIESFRFASTNFFEENTPLIFDVDFGSISLIDLVSCDISKSTLMQADECIREGRFEDSIDKIGLAFNLLIDDYETRKRTISKHSPFFFGESLTFENSFFMQIKDHRFAQFVDKVKNSIEAMQQAMKIISLGIDFKRYSKFQQLIPNFTKLMSGNYSINRDPRRKPPTIEEIQYCYDFVIECALNLQDFDYDLEGTYKS